MRNYLEKLIKALKQDNPGLHFIMGENNDKTSSIHYKPVPLPDSTAVYGVISLSFNDIYSLRDLAFVMAHEIRHLWQRNRYGREVMEQRHALLCELFKKGKYRQEPFEHDADLYGLEFLAAHPEFNREDLIINPDGDEKTVKGIIAVCEIIRSFFDMGREFHKNPWAYLDDNDEPTVLSKRGARVLSEMRAL